MWIAAITGILPVTTFLLILVLIDNFRLVRKMTLLMCFLWGGISALICYFINTQLYHYFDPGQYTHFVSPFIEEFLKSLAIVYFVYRGMIGFRIDGAVYGFACGAGFALLENLYFLDALAETTIWVWVIRGFGTAIMHGGTVSILAIIVLHASERNKKILPWYLLGLLTAYVIHSLYNQFVFPPLISMLLILLIISLGEYITFILCDKSLNNWLDIEFDNEVNLLMQIRKGEFSKSRQGQYILSIKSKLHPLVVFDLLAYISLYLELSIKAKSNLLLKEAGITPGVDIETREKLHELQNLEKNIGKATLMLLSPVLRTSRKDLWKWTKL